MRLRQAGLAALIVAALAFAAWFFSAAPQAPQVSGMTLSGQPVSVESLRGRPYLVNFWATSCVTCVKEMPDLVALHEAYSARGFEVLAVAMAYDVPDYLSSFVQSRSLPFRVVHDQQGVWAQAFGDVRVTPTTFLVSADGRVLKRYVGPPDFDYLRRWLEQALPARPHDKTSEPAPRLLRGQSPGESPQTQATETPRG